MLKEPEVGLISEHRIEMSVVFPAPFGPRSPKISFSLMNKSKLETE